MVDVRSQQRLGGKVAHVGVQPGRCRVVVAGGQVAVAHELPAFAPGHQQHLGVGFQAHDAINDLRAYRFEHFGPVDIGLLIEPRLELDHDGDLLAAPNRLAQQLHEFRIRSGAVNGLLDRQYLRVVDGLAQKGQHTVEALERLVNADVALLESLEKRLAGLQLLRIAGLVTRKQQLGVIDQVHQLRQPEQVDRALYPVQRQLGQVELPEQKT